MPGGGKENGRGFRMEVSLLIFLKIRPVLPKRFAGATFGLCRGKKPLPRCVSLNCPHEPKF